MRKFLFILLIVGLPALSLAQNDAVVQQTIMMKMLSLRNSLLQKDSVALSKLLAEDVSYGHTNGLTQTKAELIRSVVSKEQDYKEIAPSDMKVRIYDNAAVVTMKAKVNMLYKGDKLDLQMNILLVWAKKDKDWVLVARQSVKA
jgi:hypothetical protein